MIFNKQGAYHDRKMEGRGVFIFEFVNKDTGTAHSLDIEAESQEQADKEFEAIRKAEFIGEVEDSPYPYLLGCKVEGTDFLFSYDWLDEKRYFTVTGKETMKRGVVETDYYAKSVVRALENVSWESRGRLCMIIPVPDSKGIHLLRRIQVYFIDTFVNLLNKFRRM